MLAQHASHQVLGSSQLCSGAHVNCQQAEGRGREITVQGHLWLRNELETNLGYTRRFPKEKAEL